MVYRNFLKHVYGRYKLAYSRFAELCVRVPGMWLLLILLVACGEERIPIGRVPVLEEKDIVETGEEPEPYEREAEVTPTPGAAPEPAAPKTLTAHPKIQLSRGGIKKTNRFELARYLRTSDQGYYVVGRRKSSDLTDTAQAQVWLVGNSHLSGEADQLAIPGSLDNILKKRLLDSRADQQKDYERFLGDRPYAESTLLIEGRPYNSPVSTTDESFAERQIVEQGIIENPRLGVKTVRGWENFHVILSTLTIRDALEADFSFAARYSPEKMLSNYTMEAAKDFFTLQVRNYFLFQSIVKAIQENPDRRVIVTAGTCHLACEETLFDLLDATNISYSTFEAKESLSEITLRPDIADTILESLSSTYSTEKIKDKFRNILWKQLELVVKVAGDGHLASEDDDEDGFEYLEAKREVLEHKSHMFDFFTRQAFIAQD